MQRICNRRKQRIFAEFVRIGNEISSHNGSSMFRGNLSVTGCGGISNSSSARSCVRLGSNLNAASRVFTGEELSTVDSARLGATASIRLAAHVGSDCFCCAN